MKIFTQNTNISAYVLNNIDHFHVIEFVVFTLIENFAQFIYESYFCTFVCRPTKYIEDKLLE